MWSLILNFLGGPIVNGLISAYKAKLDSANSTGAQAADVAKAALVAEVQARAEANKVILAEQGRWYTALPRVAVQGAAALFFVKCVVWDNLFGLGSTDPLRGDVQLTYNLVMSFWFGSAALTRVISTARSWWR